MLHIYRADTTGNNYYSGGRGFLCGKKSIDKIVYDRLCLLKKKLDGVQRERKEDENSFKKQQDEIKELEAKVRDRLSPCLYIYNYSYFFLCVAFLLLWYIYSSCQHT